MKKFGDLFKDSLKEYTSKFTPILKSFLILYIIPSILVAIVLGIIFLSMFSSISIDQIQKDVTGIQVLSVLANGLSPLLICLVVLVFLVYIIANVLLSISYIYIGFSKDNDISFSKCFSASKEMFWKYLGLWIVTALALIGLFILIIIPGVIFLVFWIFASYIFMNEKTGIMESLKRSKSLVKNRWWRTFGFLILLGIIVVAFSFFISLLPFIGALISAIIVQPFVTLFFKNFYLDMKKK